MNSTTQANPQPIALILGGTGKTGAGVAHALEDSVVSTRTAARSGADVLFDWEDSSTFEAALDGVDRVYLVSQGATPATVSAFLDHAEGSAVRHVTLLSAFGIDWAPAEVPLRAIELEVLGRSGLSSSILRPAWFMQNFVEPFYVAGLERGEIRAPTGDGAEAFVDALDIAAVAAATLVDPEAHAGAQYALTGPRALTMGQVAEEISAAAGREIRHVDVTPETWLNESIESGLPESYASVLAGLLAVVASGGTPASSDIESVLGRPATSFRSFAERSVDAWAVRA